MKIEGKGNDGYVNRPARGIVNVPAALRDRAERNVRRRRTVNLLVGLLVPAIVLTVFLSVIATRGPSVRIPWATRTGLTALCLPTSKV